MTFDPTWHYAVVVGINCYPAISKLQASRSDALEFKQWLLDTGVPENNISVVTTPKEDDEFADPEVAIPTRELVDAAFRRLIISVKKRQKEEPLGWQSSRLYMYLSGHGAANPSASALLMANAQRGFYSDGIAPTLYMEYFEYTQLFHELVCFSDCCRTLELTLHPTGPSWDRDVGMNGQVVKVIGFATGYGELAYEPDVTPSIGEKQPASEPGVTVRAREKPPSAYFTQALLEGLREKAVDLDTQEINSDSLAIYVKSRVKTLTAKQDPQVVGEVGAPIVFVPHTAIPRSEITIVFPVGQNGNVTLLSSRRTAICRHDPATGPLIIPLRTGLYQVEADDARPFANDGLFAVKGAPSTVRL